MLTQKYVNVRPPYGKREVSRQRIASCFGTCNESTFLNDPTGTQRFAVFSIKNFMNRRYSTTGIYIEDFLITKVWAQAYHLYANGYDPEYTHNELVANEEANELYKYNSPEYETIIEWLMPANGKDLDRQFMTSTGICTYLNSQQTDVQFTSMLLGKALTRLKFQRVKKKINGQAVYGYYVKPLKTKKSEIIASDNVRSLNF